MFNPETNPLAIDPAKLRHTFEKAREEIFGPRHWNMSSHDWSAIQGALLVANGDADDESIELAMSVVTEILHEHGMHTFLEVRREDAEQDPQQPFVLRGKRGYGYDYRNITDADGKRAIEFTLSVHKQYPETA